MYSNLLNYSFISNASKQQLNYSGQVLPSSQVLAWCMMATWVRRIFTREHLYEFLFRIAIVAHHLNLTENWLIKNRLMPYKISECYYFLYPEEVILHIGLEIVDNSKDLVSRESFLADIKTLFKNAIVMGKFMGFSLFVPDQNSKVSLGQTTKKYVPKITPELIAKAEFFANDFMRFVPETVLRNGARHCSTKKQSFGNGKRLLKICLYLMLRKFRMKYYEHVWTWCTKKNLPIE